MHRWTAATLTLAATLALALTGCAPDDPGPAKTTPASSPTASATPSATASPTPTPTPTPVALPEDCAQVGTAESRAATVDDLNLQGDGTGFVRPAPASAELVVGCDWFAGDATGVLLLVYRVDPAEAAEYVTTLPAEGYECTTGDAGNPVCQMTTPNSQYPVDTVETILSREDVWIYMSATNVDGDLLLSDLNASIWPPS